MRAMAVPSRMRDYGAAQPAFAEAVVGKVFFDN
jgi:hypothetical protein